MELAKPYHWRKLEDGGRMNKKVLLVTVLAVALLVGAYAWVKSSKNAPAQDEAAQTENLGTNEGTANAPADGAVEAQPNASSEGTPDTEEEPETEESDTEEGTSNP